MEAHSFQLPVPGGLLILLGPLTHFANLFCLHPVEHLVHIDWLLHGGEAINVQRDGAKLVLHHVVSVIGPLLYLVTVRFRTAGSLVRQVVLKVFLLKKVLDRHRSGLRFDHYLWVKLEGSVHLAHTSVAAAGSNLRMDALH